MEVEAQGKTFTFPEGTTSDQIGEAIDDYFGGQPAQDSQPVGDEDYFGSGVIEPAMAMASGMVAEPLAGIGGIADSAIEAIFNKHRNKSAAQVGVDSMDALRERLTYQPRTQSGIESMQSIGEKLAPVGEAIQGAEEYLADSTYEATDSPLAAAAASTVPTAAMMLLGIKPVRSAAKTATGVSKLQTMRGAAKEAKAVDKAIKGAAPKASDIKSASSNIYQQIDDSGAVIKAGVVDKLIDDVTKTMTKEGFHPKLHQPVAVAIDELSAARGANMPVGKLDTLRKFAQAGASNIDAPTKRLGSMMLNKIDDAMDNLGEGDFSAGATNIGGQFKQARELWGRSRRSEMMSDVLTKAEHAASGTENGIRMGIRSILKNDKKSKFFTKAERAEMSKISEGTVGSNLAKALGKAGFDISRSTNTIGGMLGAGAGGAIGGGLGAVALPAIGTASRSLAKRMTQNQHSMADALIRAGKDGRKVTKEYLTRTPKADQNPRDLATLLLNSKSELEKLRSMPLKDLPKSKQMLIKDAIFYADLMQQTKEED